MLAENYQSGLTSELPDPALLPPGYCFYAHDTGIMYEADGAGAWIFPWDDNQLLGSARVGGTAPPFLDRDGGCYMWQFGLNDELHFPSQISHQWDKTIIKPHVHWESSTTATYTGTWSWTYIQAPPAPGSAVTTALTETAPFNLAANAGEMQVSNFPDVALVNPSISHLQQIRLKLTAFTAGTAIWLWGVDFHWKKLRHRGTIDPAGEP